MQEPARRPQGVAVAAGALVLVGVLSALAGLALSAVSSCCGSSDPADPTPAAIGLVAAAAASGAGIGLWSGRLSRRAVLLCSALVPAAILAGSASSSDLQGLSPVAVLAWLGLWWYLRRRAATEWLDRRTPDRD